MKKHHISLILIFLFLCSYASAHNYLTVGADLDLGFNCDDEVKDEAGLVIPMPSIFLEYNAFKENKILGFHYDGHLIYSYSEKDFMLGLSSMIGPVFIIPLKKESGFFFSSGLTAGFMLGGTIDSKESKDKTLGLGFLGLGGDIKYFFSSGLTIGLNFTYSPLTYIASVVKENGQKRNFAKLENSFSAGISIGYTDYF